MSCKATRWRSDFAFEVMFWKSGHYPSVFSGKQAALCGIKLYRDPGSSMPAVVSDLLDHVLGKLNGHRGSRLPDRLNGTAIVYLR